jgi:hypothetical protein
MPRESLPGATERAERSSLAERRPARKSREIAQLGQLIGSFE